MYIVNILFKYIAIDPKWLLELAPKFYRRGDGKTISEEKKKDWEELKQYNEIGPKVKEILKK